MTVRVLTPPTIEVVEGGVTYPTPERPGTVIVETPETPQVVQPVVERPFVQPTPPNTPAVPNYPRKEARH